MLINEYDRLYDLIVVVIHIAISISISIVAVVAIIPLTTDDDHVVAVVVVVWGWSGGTTFTVIAIVATIVAIVATVMANVTRMDYTTVTIRCNNSVHGAIVAAAPRSCARATDRSNCCA